MALTVPDPRSATSRLFSLLGAFTGLAPGAVLNLTEIANRAQLPISTTHRMVQELVRCDALDRRRDGTYTIGFHMWEIGSQTPASVMLRNAAFPHMEDLHRIAGHEVELVVLDGLETVCVEVLACRLSPSATRPTRRQPAERSAAGLVLLAHSSELNARAHVVAGPAPDAQRRRRDAEARMEGVARLESPSGFSLAAAIRNRDSEVVAALSVAFAGGRRAGRIYEEPIREATRAISHSLGWRTAG